MNIGYVTPSYSCGYHTGVDFAPYGDTPSNPDLFSVVPGTVVTVHNDPNNALGCYVVIEDMNGDYWRYCHMVENSIVVSVGDPLTLASKIGVMGATGNVTGIHLHLEYATTSYWNCNTFMNPCDYLEIPNVTGTVVEYDGDTPGPGPGPQPAPTIRKGNFPWILISKKLRNKAQNN